MSHAIIEYIEYDIPFYQDSEFENVKLISEKVYKATFKIYQKTVALKCISLNNKSTLDNLINEVKRHRKLEVHDSILKFYGITKQENTNIYMIILEYANNGPLCRYSEKNFRNMNWIKKLNLAKQLANALMHLHSNDITHGKLTSENILVHNGNIKLNDFGIKSLKSFTNNLSPIQYTDFQYFELFNKSLDIFNLGIILWEISSGISLFDMESTIEVINDITKGKREMVIPRTPPEYIELYIDCWKHNGNSRPEITQVVKNLSNIIISDTTCELEESNMQIEESNPPLINVTAEINLFIKDLFEFFTDLFKKQTFYMRPIIIKDYIKEHNMNPVKILYTMIRHPSHHWFTSLIGFFYLYGIGTIIDNKMAFKFFSLASNELTYKKNDFTELSQRKIQNMNREIGCLYLAYMHLEGLGVAKDMLKAFHICSSVANEGSFIALNYLGLFYEKGFGVKKDEKKAFDLFLKSAEKGYLVAQDNVSLCYLEGFGTSKDETKSFLWAVKSALAGNINAMSNTGYCYENGVGVGENKKESFKWYLKAAENGDSMEQYNLGVNYANGDEIDRDQVKAFEWFKKAAENDYTNGQYMIGKYLHEGRGNKKDTIKAIYWLKKAKENGNVDATDLLEEIIDGITLIT
ncbi:hypothetical protein Glove_692g12 [Diversispora epigaea]|uniref:Protein kinase domain-containing protein n=1 Tax=Diversispora epigaea TaxID=1348612 RepID=A0A397G201_9GLOM|nr:hypothetical protein Glove_692g12 [Diversispora epigaea]